MCLYWYPTPAQWIINFGKLCCYSLNSYCTSLMVTLILYQTGSLFSALYQFFMGSHLSLGDECHPNTGYWVFTCPHGTDIFWTLNSMREKTWLYLFLLLPYFYLTYSYILVQLVCLTYWNYYYFSPSSCYILQFFFTIDPIQCIMNDFQGRLIISLLDESVFYFPTKRSLGQKMSEACSRWSCPLEVLL